jgi:hypothetical protein
MTWPPSLRDFVPDSVTTRIDNVLEAYRDLVARLPQRDRPVFLRLTAVLANHGGHIPDALAESIAAASRCRTDPDWRLAALERSVARWDAA